MKNFLLISILALTDLFCSSQSSYIVFGSGGGFTGQYSVYKLFPNGKVLKGSGRTEMKYLEYSKIKKSEASRIINELNELKIVSFSEPGNMSYFIKLYHDGKETNYTWGAKGFKVPEELVNIYRNVITDFSKLTYRKLKKETR